MEKYIVAANVLVNEAVSYLSSNDVRSGG